MPFGLKWQQGKCMRNKFETKKLCQRTLKRSVRRARTNTVQTTEFKFNQITFNNRKGPMEMRAARIKKEGKENSGPEIVMFLF